LHPALLAALSPLSDEPDSFVLPRMHLWHISRSFRRLVGRLGLGDFHFHDLRHDVATSLASQGASTPAIKAALGHRDCGQRLTEALYHRGRRAAQVDAKRTKGRSPPPLGVSTSAPPRAALSSPRSWCSEGIILGNPVAALGRALPAQRVRTDPQLREKSRSSPWYATCSLWSR
jgi:hypothetical protein